MAIDVSKYRSGGGVLITANAGSQNVQASGYNAQSFTITNIGSKKVTSVLFDITGALYPDTVFDPLGLAGDSVARGLTFGSTGGTGAIAPARALDPFEGAGGAAGYERMTVSFSKTVNNGFTRGETVTFGVDIDANSILGLPQKPKTIAGADPRLAGWDIGGVSGAELIGSRVTVTFADGSKTSAQLMGDGSQAGAVALASQAVAAKSAILKVNGVAAGGVTRYDDDGATVSVSGPDGAIARIVMTRGFVQPFDYVAPNGAKISVADKFKNAAFKANNALEFQTVDVVLDGKTKNVSKLFDFDPPGGALGFPGDSALPIRFVASLVDAGGAPIGPVSAPITLTYGPTASPPPPAPPPPSTPPPAPTEPFAVFLVDADADVVLARIVDGGVIDAALLTGRSLSLYAEANAGSQLAGKVGSVRLDFNDGVATRVENVTPYALFPEVDGDFTGGLKLGAGSHEIALQAFSRTGARGDKLADLTFDFTVSGSGGAAPLRADATFGGSRYKLGTPGLNWLEAQAEARAMGGDLVTISSAAENAFVFKAFGGKGPIWLGLNDRAVEGEFRWSNGEDASYRNFLPGNPDNRNNEDYVAITGPQGEWNDAGLKGGWIYDGARWFNDAINQTVVEF